MGLLGGPGGGGGGGGGGGARRKKCGAKCGVRASTSPGWVPPVVGKGRACSEALCAGCGVVYVPDLYEMGDESVGRLPVTRAHLEAACAKSRSSIKGADLRHYEEFTASCGER